jgi:hypothetical protein
MKVRYTLYDWNDNAILNEYNAELESIERYAHGDVTIIKFRDGKAISLLTDIVDHDILINTVMSSDEPLIIKGLAFRIDEFSVSDRKEKLEKLINNLANVNCRDLQWNNESRTSKNLIQVLKGIIENREKILNTGYMSYTFSNLRAEH